MAKDVENWAEEGKAFGNLGIAYRSLGRYSKANEPWQPWQLKGGGRPGGGGRGVPEPRQRVSFAGGLCEGHRVPHAGLDNGKGGGRLQRKWATGRGRARRTGTSGARIIRMGPFPRPSSTTRSTWRLQRRWATGRERARRTGTSGACTSRWGTFPRPSSTTRSALRLQRRWATGRGRGVRDLGIAYYSLGDFSKAIVYH
jgi:hypothetical protein